MGGFRKGQGFAIALATAVSILAAIGALLWQLAAGSGPTETATAESASASELPPETSVPEFPSGFPDQPVDDDDADSQPYGWGTSQPYKMSATVEFGGSPQKLAPERRELLAEQLVEARNAALEIGTVAEAERLGFVRNFQWVDGRGFEYINWDRFTDDLDLSKPSLLAFDGDDPESKVVSVAYNVLGTAEDGPPPDLPLEAIPWHYHSNLCQVDGTFVGSVDYDVDGKPYQDQIDRCTELGATFHPELNHWMVDLWVIPGWENPWGLVSSYHPDLFPEPTPWFPSETEEALSQETVEAQSQETAFCDLTDWGHTSLAAT